MKRTYADDVADTINELEAERDVLRAALAKSVMLADVATVKPSDLLNEIKEIGQTALNETAALASED
jgi:hypothetical protein